MRLASTWIGDSNKSLRNDWYDAITEKFITAIGQTTEFCTPMNSLDLYVRRLDLKQFECLCEFVRKRYAGHIDVLRRKMGYLELTRFERSCITEYLTRQQTLKAKYTRNNNDFKEVNGVNS
ncbi:unnamed protein product [Angiostrongylus costaricensis]|uniref:Uncharacterized protein n=1 Tax=Angiostrongylus costaricensis TaxID=334426 RepID=A0A0R3Q0F7_ANGCS|nr:unnamed protein product [Angiostrongylus costaricensis]